MNFAGFSAEYFKVSKDGEPKDKKLFLLGCRSILTSKGSEDSLVSETKPYFICFDVHISCKAHGTKSCHNVFENLSIRRRILQDGSLAMVVSGIAIHGNNIRRLDPLPGNAPITLKLLEATPTLKSK